MGCLPEQQRDNNLPDDVIIQVFFEWVAQLPNLSEKHFEMPISRNHGKCRVAHVQRQF